MCKEKDESINHLLDECRIANSLWEKGVTIFRRDHRHRGRPDITLAEWPINSFKNKIVNRLWELFPGFTIWEVWKTRNKQTFENKERKLEEIWNSIKTHMKETITLQSWSQEEFTGERNECSIPQDFGLEEIPPDNSIAHSCLVQVSSPLLWIPPPARTFKINVDGGAKGNPGPAGFGGVIRNPRGSILSLFWGSIGSNMNKMAELEGLINGLI